MPDQNAILTALRDELVTQGLVRRANQAGPESSTPAPPPCHVEPIAPPAPGEREDPENDATLVVTLRLSTTLGELPFDAFRRRAVIDVVYRSKTTDGLKRARELDAAIVNALCNRPDYGLGWVMGSGGSSGSPVLVLSSSIYGGLGPVARDAGQGNTDVAKYVFEVKAD